MGRKKTTFYGSGKFDTTGKIHKTKKAADKVAESCKNVGISYRIRKLKGGWRVDKRF